MDPLGTLEEGAANAVDVCVGVQPGERVLVVTDRAQAAVGRALANAAIQRTDLVQLVVLEDIADRPLKGVPDALARVAEKCDVSFWAADSVKGELPARMAYGALVRGRARHGHMPGVTAELMRTGMCADYDAVADLTTRLWERLQGVGEARVTSPLGTDLTATFNPEWHWLPDTGKLREPGDWGNLPAGEVFTAPASLEGTVVTTLLGDWFSEEYGPLDPPVRFEVRDSRVDLDSISGGPEGLAEAFREYLTTDENSSRAGEFALGTNLALTEPVGNLLQDEKIIGVHVAFGDAYGKETGAPWSSRTHVDAVCPDTTVWLDGERVMDAGEYVF